MKYFSVINVLRKKELTKACIALYDLIIFAVMIFTIFFVVIANKDSYLIENYPKLVLFLFGFSFAKLVGHLQIAHLAAAPFEQFRKTILAFLFFMNILSVINIMFESGKNSILIFDFFIVIFIIFNFFSWLHFAYFVSEELCEVLDINRFSIKPKIKNDNELKDVQYIQVTVDNLENSERSVENIDKNNI
jgi:hypothetical protein